MSTLRPLVKIHGGGYYKWRWIVSYFPQNYEKMAYIEPFLGGGSVFLNKKPSPLEILNDLDRDLMTIWSMVQWRYIEFKFEMENTPYTQATFDLALSTKNYWGDLHRASMSYIKRRMSRGGLQKSFAWSDRLRGGKPGDVNGWETAVSQLPLIAKRLSQNCTLFNRPAVEIINKHNLQKTVLYVDPPFVHETRVSKKAYEFEMSEADHIELSESLNNFKGKVLLSGYNSKLYDRLYKDWNKVEKRIVNNSSQKKKKDTKVEVLWLNY